MAESNAQDGFSFFQKLPWEKMVTWGVFLGLVYVLSSLFAVFFITFVVSYICRNFVKFVYSPFGDRAYIRKIIVVITFALLLFGFYLGGRFLVPNIYEQGSKVFTMVRDLKIHEGLDNALPNLYATFRYQFFKNTDEHIDEFKEFKKRTDPGKLGFERFRDDSLGIRNGFREKMIEEYGQAAYETARKAPDFKEEMNSRIEELIVNKEYALKKDELEADAEQELMDDMSDGAFDRLKNKYGATAEEWSEYLKLLIMPKIYEGIDDKKRVIYQEELKTEHILEQGTLAVLEVEGTDEWQSRFQEYYAELPENLRRYPYQEFISLESAKDQSEYLELRGGMEEAEEDLVLAFKKDKENEFAGTIKDSEFVIELNDRIRKEFLPSVTKWVYNAIAYTFSLAFYLIVSIFLSFFIVWDIPRLKTMIRKLENSRIGEFYKEVCPGMVSFGWLMGRAFQAQAIIAAVNTALTLSALNLLAVPHRAFLCSIVFICSFIPVVGVIISSVPIVVVALQLDGGIVLALELIGCILIIHFIETTLLNPKIMGDMLKLHPLLVLVILLVGEHFFGVWGLLLGVPVTVYIFRFVILQDPKGHAAKALSKIFPPSEVKEGG